MAPRAAALVGTTVYVGSSWPSRVYALDAGTGAVVWQTHFSNGLPDPETSPVVAGGLRRPRPLASNLNVVPNQTVPNLIAKVGADGKVSVYNTPVRPR